MAIMNVFKTTTTASSQLDASQGSENKQAVSDFLTVQSFTNFAAMTGAISAAWQALQQLVPGDSRLLWVPYLLALIWAIVSVLISLEGLRKEDGVSLDLGAVLGAVFVGVINSLVLAGAVVGTSQMTGGGS